MNNAGKRTRLEWKRARFVAPLLLLLLAGCDNDRPYEGPPPGPPQAQATSNAGPVASTSDSSAPSGDNSAPASPPDPLIGNAGQVPPDPFLGHDPLAGRDPLGGRAMPTEHSHWLQCRLLHDAHVTVLLNGLRYKSYSGVFSGDDITMRLREGMNTVTFVYQPNETESVAEMEIVEGEHHPPIAPLATFRSSAVSAGSGDISRGDAWKPVTQTFHFVAR